MKRAVPVKPWVGVFAERRTVIHLYVLAGT